jgi:hypothetical protein
MRIFLENNILFNKLYKSDQDKAKFNIYNHLKTFVKIEINDISAFLNTIKQFTELET